MPNVTCARASANYEVGYIAWGSDGKIPECLGFEVTRVYLDPGGNVAKRPDGSEDRVKCAAWVAFKGQRNPDWLPQDTGVWPVQKFSWRDLTLRKKRIDEGPRHLLNLTTTGVLRGVYPDRSEWAQDDKP